MGERAAASPPPGPTSGPNAPSPGGPSSGRSPLGLVQAACPYLVARGGRWRSATPTPEHRCTAVDPPAPLALAKQRRLCLDAGHRSCATFLAAQGDLGGEPVGPGAPLGGPRGGAGRQATRWQFVETIPLVLDGGSRFGLLAGAGNRIGQAGLIVLVVAAFGTLVLARSATGPGGTAAASLAPSQPASPAASAALPTPTPTVAMPSPTPPPTEPAVSSSPAAVSPTPVASFRTYRVVAGDTLSAIAARFGTTVKAIVDLNGISDPSRIRPGQILRIP